MNSFNFGRKVEICGEIYYLSRDMDKIAEAMKKCSDEMIGLGQDQNMSQEEMMEKVRANARETIDTVFGEGAYEKIFRGAEEDMVNLVSLVDFITAEINLWKRELMAKSMAGKELLSQRKGK